MGALRRFAAGLTAVTALLAVSPAWSAGASPSPENLALAKRYMAAVHIDRQMDGMMRNLMPAMLAQVAKDSKLTPDQQEILTEVVAESAKDLATNMMDRMTPLFAQTFTTKELRDLVAFYEGPSGQSMMAKMPELMKGMAPMMLELMPQMQTDMTAKLCARMDCKALAKPGNSPTPS